MAAVTLPIVTTYNDKGVKGAQFSLKGLVTSQLGATVSAGLLAKELGKAVTAFNDDEKAAEQLKIAVQNSTGATDLQVASMEKQIAKMESTSAVSDDKLRPSLQNLVRATEDLDQAQGLLNLALDISAGTGKDLETVSLALAKAQNGNIGALTRLGVSLDADAVKSKDLETIQRQLATSFKGASEAAAKSSAGGMAQFQITVDNLYELVGSKLSPVVNDFATILNNVIPTAAEKASGETNKVADSFFKIGKQLFAGGLIDKLEKAAKLLHFVAGESDTVASSVTYTAAEFRDMDNLLSNKYNETLKKTTKGTDDLKKKQEEARKAAKDHADTLRDRVVTAVDAVALNLQKAKDQLQDFADATADAITGNVSLAEAFKTQTDAEKGVNDALKARSEAYTDLKKINPKEDAEQYAEALQKVAEAEANVTAAQSVRSSSGYINVFKQQINDAKAFSANLQTLVGLGLNKAGLAQLINLGPIAGKAVTDDLINGRQGLNVAELNQSLNEISAAGQNLGLAAGNAFFGANVTAGQGAVDTVNNLQITVNAGLVSNPAQVGRDIIEAILAAERLSGQVFVSA
jgi:hypothetical protein